MQKQNYYITQSGTIKRKDSTVWFENEKIRKAIPVNSIDTIYCLGEVSINSKLLVFLAKQGIILHFFNYYGYYSGSFYPKESLVSGSLLVNQVNYYTDSGKRLFLAKSFISGTIQNLIRILEHYRKHSKEVGDIMDKLAKGVPKLDSCSTIPELMNVEGCAWNDYYSSYEEILKEEFEVRTRRPPHNEVNCVISFLNSLLYTTTLSEIYHTQLNPTISYLHEPFERRFSLALDISEMFKPLIVQRAMLKLFNKSELKDNHFRKDLNSCMLNEDGRRIVLKEFDDRLKLTIEHPELKRLVSHRRLIRLESYKLVKHLIGDKTYSPFVIWW
ncbi:MAG TPA: type I-B CRISPR-associated endonuclease Cas1b [Candidatus Nanoarchaeia archaeon]|nr:type I-B CRISPR-associated endonuclease Cas1b [Candidatus Nanoarchaeia archaeon]